MSFIFICLLLILFGPPINSLTFLVYKYVMVNRPLFLDKNIIKIKQNDG